MAGSIQDITDRRQAEKDLRESEARLHLALGALNGGVWDWNVQTGEVHFTASWARMLGYEPKEIEALLARNFDLDSNDVCLINWSRLQ